MKRKILIISAHTPSLFWFRLDLMKDMISEGYDVVACGQQSEALWKEKFAFHGIEYLGIPVERNGTNPLKDVKTFFALYRLIKTVNPDKIFVYQAKTIIYGSIAARLLGVREVYALIAGVGSVFLGKGFKNRIIKTILKIQYFISCRLCRKVFFQNEDDRNTFVLSQLVQPAKIVMIHGSGVNMQQFQPQPYSEKNVFLFIGRLVKDKGVLEYLQAAEMVKQHYPETEFLLVGPYDSNPSAVTEQELTYYTERNIVQYYGEQTDVRPFLNRCNVFVLPSYHEGTPKSVLEAMATARVVITTDAPGCRETVKDGVNGFLVPIKDSVALAGKMEYLIRNPQLIPLMGKAGYQICKEIFDVKKVNRVIFEAMEI